MNQKITQLLQSLSHQNNNFVMHAAFITTPLGDMIAISSSTKLYILKFIDSPHLEKKIKKLCHSLQASIIMNNNRVIDLIEKELKQYFDGTLQKFTTPIHLDGTEFQKASWKEIIATNYGETKSYLDQASNINKKKAVRAVASANGCNKLAIIIPCHRIINKSGKLGGYNGGLTRKKWMLNHEEKFK